MADTLTAPEVVHLSSANPDGKVWVKAGNWVKLCTVNQVVEAVQAAHARDRPSREEVFAQLDDLVAHLVPWLAAHDAHLADAFIEAGSVGRLTLVLVQTGRAFDPVLTEHAADLEADLANDDRFKLLRVDVLVAPGFGPRVTHEFKYGPI